MRICTSLLAAAVLLQSCTGADAPGQNAAAQDGRAEPGAVAPQGPDGAVWSMQSGGEGALQLGSSGGTAAIRLFCRAGTNQIIVNVPAFRPIGSEERLSFGSGGEALALVADPRGDAQLGGVSGTGPVPENLKRLMAGPISASYGAQTSGPHPAPPGQLASAFVGACSEGRTAAGIAASKPTASTSPCMVQDGALLRISPLRAVGTEPFWGARIDGRCVTYSHPDDQRGTRIWTRFTSGPDGGIWVGTLAGKPFVLRTRAAANCSDGMSDKRYPFAVALSVGGEERTGCAEPL